MSADTNKSEETAPELSDEQVRDYLKEHSDFFQHHPDMLDYLHISHSSGSAVSLVEKQVSVLRERNMEMRKRLNNLTGNARDNDRLYELTRKLVLALLETDSLAELVSTFAQSLVEDFEVEHVSLILFGNPGQSTEQYRIESGRCLANHAPARARAAPRHFRCAMPAFRGNSSRKRLELGSPGSRLKSRNGLLQFASAYPPSPDTKKLISDITDQSSLNTRLAFCS